ncbi:hypothetical protein Q7C_205 [Methylophaga frappieri]|uniref:Uncharacterized protein n=1 Tax=Methylophaga frappieri (strain ATCC BAA-2434 / DSM 25690 / JAM7) TaxID=754477 RepID=I1YEP3_METFJ|nr:hypothetical protein Q7C_205 [Methylophaga frappieri]
MAFFIDCLYIGRELGRLALVIITSPFAIISSVLMLGSAGW